MANALPFYKMYPKDFDTDEKCRGMSLEEAGLYLFALNHAWVNGGLPSEDEQVGRVLRLTVKEVRYIWPQVKQLFELYPDGRLRNPRQEKEREAARSKSEAATRSVRHRYERNTNVDRSYEDRRQNVVIRASESVFSSSSQEEEASFDAEKSFDELWTAYHQKGRVKQVLSQHYYVEEVHTPQMHAKVMAAVKGKWANSEKWAKGFVMSLPEWIHNRCWEEEPEPDKNRPVVAKPGDPIDWVKILGRQPNWAPKVVEEDEVA